MSIKIFCSFRRYLCLTPEWLVFAWISAISPLAIGAEPDALARVRDRGTLVWGADSEGGGPYVYPSPSRPDEMQGFEVELAQLLADELHVTAEFRQGQWTSLPALLGTGQIDIILNGYELTGPRAGRMAHTVPYYIYQLSLLVRRDNARLRAWDDLARPAPRKPRVGVLTGSGAEAYLKKHYADHIVLVGYEGNTDAMREVETGKLDATVADSPVAVFYRDRFPQLKQAGPPAGRGYYVIYLRQNEPALKQALDRALVHSLEDGRLRALYERYGLWSNVQEELLSHTAANADLGIRATRIGGWEVIRTRGPLLIRSAGMTVLLACASMPLAILAGLLIALGRLYGPTPLRWMLATYVEVIRGTPLLLQLWVIFFLLPEIGVGLPAVAAAIAGLAINYSAYEAEIYRAGIQAIPRGQMEAALALGMSPAMALRRIIVPQAVRIVIPPVTNDFIALFKDTSVCSVITVMELTKQYTVQANDTGAIIELAAMTALLYLLMSVPLSHLASRMEKRMRGKRHD